MNLHRILTIITFIISCPILAQSQYPKDYFRSPLDIPLQLSGNFGELRSNHFHAGFDFRTQQKEGLNVYAAAAGYVSRIKISAYGYGKAIYIDHPNGYTTVYGHLKRGSAAVERYIKAQHYKEQNFEIDVFPKPGELVVTKGDLIAYSGNTGGSGGPHLHFEIRETNSEKILNPLHFGFDSIIIDTKKPVVTDLVVYPINEQSVVNTSAEPVVLNLSPQPDGSYLAGKVSATGKVGFGINAYDSNNYSTNKNGVYKVESYVNGSLSFGYQFDEFAFNESRYINALIDFSRFKRVGQRVQKLFMKQPFPLSIIRTDDERGILNVSPNVTQTYRIEVSDFNNNKSIITVPIEYSNLPPTSPPAVPGSSSYFLRSGKDYNFEKDNFSVFIPENTFYEDFYIKFDVSDNVLTLGNPLTPVHSNFTVSVKVDGLSDADADKMFIASVSGNQVNFNSTKRKANTFTTYTKNLGQFKVVKDTIAPKVSAVKPIENKAFANGRALELYISDNLSGIREFDGYVNGKWALFEYDYKTRKITHNIDDEFAVVGRNELKVVVSDNVGNSTIFETHFYMTQK
ncbi:MAG TPA: M23 family metallopeptidase [Flavobacterium sp.]|jgi:murein DD-endopeptidase MepM/ murein hydrolase activator NlpD